MDGMGMGGARKKKKKSSGGGGGGGGANANPGTMLTSAVVIGMGVIGIILLMEVFGDLIANNNLDPYIGLEIILGIIPTIAALGVAVGGGLTGFIGYKGKSMNMKEALMAPMILIIGAVMVPFLMAVIGEALASTYVASFTAIDIALSIICTMWALGMMAISGSMMWSTKKRHLG